MVDVVKEALEKTYMCPEDSFNSEDVEFCESVNAAMPQTLTFFLQHIRDHGPDHLMNCAEGFNLRCDSAGDNTGYFNSQKAFLDHLIERLQTPGVSNG